MHSFYNLIMLLQVIMPQMFYDIISTLHQNVTVGTGRCIIPGVTMAGHVRFSFTIKKDNGSEVYSPDNIKWRELEHWIYLLNNR